MLVLLIVTFDVVMVKLDYQISFVRRNEVNEKHFKLDTVF